MIAEGLACWPTAARARALPLQAAIAACHARAPRPEDTDWPRIASLYAALGRARPHRWSSSTGRWPSRWPTGPTPASACWTPGGRDLDRYHLFHAARADLLRRAGRPPTRPRPTPGARAGDNDAERRYLERRLAALAT